jgi:hypothetical protein
MSAIRPLSGVNRPCRKDARMANFDPKRASPVHLFCVARFPYSPSAVSRRPAFSFAKSWSEALSNGTTARIGARRPSKRLFHCVETRGQ